MNHFFRLTVMVIAGILAITMVTSVVGATITDLRSAAVKTQPDEMTDEELKTLFAENHELLLDIATQMIPLCEKHNLYRVLPGDEQLIAKASGGKIITTALSDSLQQQLKQYFGIVGTNNDPWVLVTGGTYVGYIVVKFNFRLTNAHHKGILYDPKGNYGVDYGFELLGDNFYLYEDLKDGPPPEPEAPQKWWEKWPGWLQWILRYLCFGWSWMK